jgi:hypothetical protein
VFLAGPLSSVARLVVEHVIDITLALIRYINIGIAMYAGNRASLCPNDMSGWYLDLLVANVFQ